MHEGLVSSNTLFCRSTTNLILITDGELYATEDLNTHRITPYTIEVTVTDTYNNDTGTAQITITSTSSSLCLFFCSLWDFKLFNSDRSQMHISWTIFPGLFF